MPTKNQAQPINPDVFAPDDEAPAGGDAGAAFVIDFTTIPDVNEPLPAALYNCTIVAAEPAVSKAGNPMIKLRWRVDDEGDYHKRTIFDQLVWAEGSLWYIRQVLQAIGFDSKFAGAVNPEALIGERATLTVVIKAGKGINPETQEPYPPRNAITKVAPVGTRRKVDDYL